MAITNAAFAALVNNGAVPGPTAYTITGTDVTNGISIPASFFTANAYGQPGFILERLTLIFNTTTAGTAFTAIVKPTVATTDVPNSAPPFPLANAGQMSSNINAIGVYYFSGLTSGRFLQPDGSLLINFTGTLGVTTLAGLLAPYAPAGPRG